MKRSKCPRCELNYVRPGQTLCDVCMRELGKVPVQEEPEEICPACNEHPVVPGEELCKFCLRERQRLESAELAADEADEEEEAASMEGTAIEAVDPDALEGLELDGDDEEIPETELDEIDTELGLDEEEEEDDEDLLD